MTIQDPMARTKATSFFITGLFHVVIDLCRRILGGGPLDSSPLFPDEQSFTR